MKITLAQIKPVLGNRKQNISKIIKYLKEKKESDLIIFPELFLTGYEPKLITKTSENINSPIFKEFLRYTSRFKTTLIFGFIEEPRPGLFYNSACIITPSDIFISRKIFLPTFGPFDEGKYFCKSSVANPVITPFGKIGVIICYDIFFPEVTRAHVLKGAEIIVCISASPAISKKYFEVLTQARAIENTIFLCYVNYVGKENNLQFWGGSRIISPLGNILITAKENEEDIVTHEIDIQELKQARITRPYLRDFNLYPDFLSHYLKPI